ncbi:SRPBCC domain-containing protein [Actinomycetospora sp.]|uniref:SRPBCC family protein n=1 Tax=Actinomycetospora sp. TaxID=1872135 RepID=UPI002F3FC4D3
MSEHAPTTADGYVLITREFGAPPAEVFRAWTDPETLAAWYGPEQAETPPERVHIDLRVGGRYELTMLLPGGREFTVAYEIVELVEPELLVLRSDPMPEMGMTEPATLRVELHEHGPGTRMTLRDGPYPTPGRDGAEAGWTSAAAALAKLLEAG